MCPAVSSSQKVGRGKRDLCVTLPLMLQWIPTILPLNAQGGIKGGSDARGSDSLRGYAPLASPFCSAKGEEKAACPFRPAKGARVSEAIRAGYARGGRRIRFRRQARSTSLHPSNPASDDEENPTHLPAHTPLASLAPLSSHERGSFSPPLDDPRGTHNPPP